MDEVGYYTYKPSVKDSKTWPFDLDQYILLNIAMGGYAGTIDPSFTQSPMIIDYVRVYQESVASVSKINNLFDVKTFPNPVNDKLNIEFSSDLGEIKGTIYSLTGQKIQTFVQNSSKKTIETADLSKGIYFLKLESTKGTSTHKIVKK